MQTGAIVSLQERVWAYYRAHGRHDLPWRQPQDGGDLDPYAILVSEIMLQQTQVGRVMPKFTAFMAAFPTVQHLAAASLGDVLKQWSGLGYNRRAKFLWQAAHMIMADFGGKVPHTSEELVRLPGVGKNTAGAVLAYAYNMPVVFIETNIRAVYIHHLFVGQTAVLDRDIADAVAASLPDNPREWYWALMDYGTYVKQTVGNTARSSAHYTQQSTFQGSRRQVRGQIVRALGDGAQTAAQLADRIVDKRLEGVLADLIKEGMIRLEQGYYVL